MPPKFQSAVHRRGSGAPDDITYLKLSGVIDEDNELSTLAEQVNSGTLVVDLSEIERINSCGVRDWVNWLGKVEKTGSKVVLSECSPSIVAQINLVNNFTGQGVVKSFYAPYFCPQCDHEKVLLIETRDAVGQKPFKAPTCRCDECDGPMDFDDMEDSFFAFLSNTSKIITDSRVDEVVAEFTPSESGPKLRTRTGPGSNPSSGPSPVTATGSSPSAMSSLPSMRRSISGNHPIVPTGKSVLAASEELSRRIPLQAPSSNNKAWIVAGVLVAAALGLVAYLFLAQPESAAHSNAAPPAATETK
jgi:anti-anti-sigma regulatory factor